MRFPSTGSSVESDSSILKRDSPPYQAARMLRSGSIRPRLPGTAAASRKPDESPADSRNRHRFLSRP
nr:hypothetical protein Iba_scaffold736947CG0010 [Ipomoea batatas]